MANTPEEWADDLIEAWVFGTDVEEQLSKSVMADLREKARASFLLAIDQGFRRGLGAHPTGVKLSEENTCIPTGSV